MASSSDEDNAEYGPSPIKKQKSGKVSIIWYKNYEFKKCFLIEMSFKTWFLLRFIFLNIFISGYKWGFKNPYCEYVQGYNNGRT